VTGCGQQWLLFDPKQLKKPKKQPFLTRKSSRSPLNAGVTSYVFNSSRLLLPRLSP
jgi:hypothetical protein